MPETVERKAEVINPGYAGARILVWVEPDKKLLSLPRAKTVLQLLHALNLETEEALVARSGKLLTHDRRIWPNDELWVRIVASRG